MLVTGNGERERQLREYPALCVCPRKSPSGSLNLEGHQKLDSSFLMQILLLYMYVYITAGLSIINGDKWVFLQSDSSHTKVESQVR